MRTYSIATPSISGVLSHEALSYDGIRRPAELNRFLDGSAAREKGIPGDKPFEEKLMEQYFYDLYSVFMKRLSAFALDSGPAEDETVKLQAMLQEMIKVKRILGKGK